VRFKCLNLIIGPEYFYYSPLLFAFIFCLIPLPPSPKREGGKKYIINVLALFPGERGIYSLF